MRIDVSPPLGTSAQRALAAGLFATATLLAAACSTSSGTGGSGGSSGKGGTSSSSTTSSSGTGGSSSSSGTGTGGTGGAGRPMDPPITVALQGRTYDVYFPPALDPTKPAPLFLELHGLVASSTSATPWLDEEAANHFKPEAAARGVILVLPHATIDPTTGSFFWNATDACCDVDKLGTNDIGYLAGVIDDVAHHGAKAAENLPQPVPPYTVDEKRVFAFGHGAGGFMVNRMACDMADKIAGVVSMAGETYLDPSRCAASAPIAFLEVQGDADATVPYAGGTPMGITGLAPAPGALQTTRQWGQKNNCNPVADTSEPLFQLMSTSAGPDTSRFVYATCEANGHTELWTLHLGPYAPPWTAAWALRVFDYVMAYPKP